MDLNNIHTRIRRISCASFCLLHDSSDLLYRQSMASMILRREDRILTGRYMIRNAWRACMNPAISRAQLNRHLCPILVSLVYKFLKPRHMGWRSKMPAGIKGTLPVIGNRHRRRVNKSKAAFRTLDQIVRLLLRHAAIRITHNAHRRYHQPVPKRHAANCYFIK